MEIGEVKEVSILDIASGAIKEQLEHESGKIFRNIKDPNTNSEGVRKLTITLTFKPSENRENISVTTKTESKLQPIKSVESALILAGDELQPVAMEYSNQISGQMSLDGNVISMPNKIKTV